MSALITTLFCINAVLLITLISMARSFVFGCYAGSLVNPLVVLSTIMALFNIDFLVLWSHPHFDFMEHVSAVTQEAILNAYSTFTLLSFSALLGMIGAFVYWGRRPTVAHYPEVDEVGATAALIVLVVALAISAPVLAVANYGSLLQDYSFQVITRENQFLAIATWMVPPGAAIFVAYRRVPISAVTVLVLGLLALLIAVPPGFFMLPPNAPADQLSAGGARLPALMIGFILAVAYASYRRLPAVLMAFALPASGWFLAYTRYLFREGGKYPSFADFLDAHGGIVSLFFSSEELSFAKVFTVAYDLAPSWPRAPFESFVALILLPIPRSQLGFKPFGASAMLTQHVSPLRWDLTKSESLITGYGDLYWQFGTLGAAVVVALMAYLWLWTCLKVIHSSRAVMLFWLPILIWVSYIFVRADVFNMGLLLWPAAVTALLHRTVSSAMRLETPGARFKTEQVAPSKENSLTLEGL